MTEDEARTILRNPAATAEQLARIAREFPRLRVDVVNHPGVTSDILVWLMKYGDDDVRTAIADWAAPPASASGPAAPSPEPHFTPYPVSEPTTESERPEEWVDATGAGKICGSCHHLLTPAGSDRLTGVIGSITGTNPRNGMPVSGRDLPFAGYASKICPNCGVGNRHALIPPAKGAPAVPSSGYASLGLTPRDRHGTYPVYSPGSSRTAPVQTPRYISDDAPSAGYAVLGFFIPIVGLILFLVWTDDHPLRARSAGKGALTSVIIGVLLVILRACIALGS